ncbi:MAG: hypothetical protein J7K75_00215 [Desulfuromonas sp.]|nr:hypothetical protein [Desulfuromonas sp.]
MDQTSIEVLERVIRSLPAQRITVVVASHDADQPQRLNSELIELAGGHIV